jgi:hypothetical protein
MISRLMLLLLLVLAACGGDSLSGFGEPCRSGAECADGVCFDAQGFGEGTCTSACAGSADCASGTTCGTLADGSRACLRACTDDSAIAGYGCVDGAHVACERASSAVPCEQCGCPDGMTCPDDGGGTCQPLAAEGEACARNDDCASSNCSVHESSGSASGICLVAGGAACTPGDGTCRSCDATATGNVCAQSCGGVDGCGGPCIGSDTGGYHCRQDCFASRRCPAYWTCEVLSAVNEVAYCAPPDRCDPTQTSPCGLFGTCDPTLRICI